MLRIGPWRSPCTYGVPHGLQKCGSPFSKQMMFATWSWRSPWTLNTQKIEFSPLIPDSHARTTSYFSDHFAGTYSEATQPTLDDILCELWAWNAIDAEQGSLIAAMHNQQVETMQYMHQNVTISLSGPPLIMFSMSFATEMTLMPNVTSCSELCSNSR